MHLEEGHVRVRTLLEGVGRGVSNDSPCAVGVLTAKVLFSLSSPIFLHSFVIRTSIILLVPCLCTMDLVRDNMHA